MAVTKNDILNYVMTTPENTNPAILIQLLDEFQASDNTDENLIPENIKNGVTIFGVTGTYSGESSNEEQEEQE